MNVEFVKQKLVTPEEFEFPFTPYSIQHDFMTNLYSVIEEGKLGIFESPTGTGKSLSIICGALRWLKDHEARERSELNEAIASLKVQKDKLSSSGDDWLNSQAHEIEITKKLQMLQLEVNKITKNDEKIAKLKQQKTENERNKYKFNSAKKDAPKLDLHIDESEEDTDLLLEDNIELNLDDGSDHETEVEDLYEGVKIYICSRTHSQIAQLVHEVERSPFGDDIRLVSLASRQSYCINPTVNKLNNPALISEKCLDMQRSSKGKSTVADKEGRAVKKKRAGCRCPYMQIKTVDQLKESALLQVQDVEQLVLAGKKLNACPYYAARSAVADAQVVVVPYNVILHKSTREASGIKLKNSVVIIDEAHNLLEALADMHSAHISGHQVLYAQNQLTEYRNKYKPKFSAQNLLYINQLLFIIGQFVKVLGRKSDISSDKSETKSISTLFTLQDFLTESDIGHLNIYKILKFCSHSKLSQKLNGFAIKHQVTVNIHEHKKPDNTGIAAFLKEISKNNKPQGAESVPVKELVTEDQPRNPMLIVIAFLDALTNRCEDGRVVCVKQATVGKGFLKYLLLNPATHFSQIVSDARSILVAGGTMQPISEFRERLFVSAGAQCERIVEFSCDHIVSPENILPIALLSGPTGHNIDISYGSRNSMDTLNEIGRVLQNLCAIVPGGVVCFFPSYDYEKLVYEHLEKCKVLEQLAVKKQIFREPKLTADVDKVLTQYARTIKSCTGSRTGALMFSVVGGKLSEGLNFSDDLGRCIVVIGLPYANIKSAELQEKMSYLNKNEGPNAGNIYYENLCMKAVNQCIGRAVRHKDDYACVVLLDNRYARPKTQQALPTWIQRSLVTHGKFGLAYATISRFFAAKK